MGPSFDYQFFSTFEEQVEKIYSQEYSVRKPGGTSFDIILPVDILSIWGEFDSPCGSIKTRFYEYDSYLEEIVEIDYIYTVGNQIVIDPQFESQVGEKFIEALAYFESYPWSERNWFGFDIFVTPCQPIEVVSFPLEELEIDIFEVQSETIEFKNAEIKP